MPTLRSMDIDDIMNTAKDALSKVSDEQIDGAAEKVKDKAPDQADGLIDMAATFLEGHNDK